ncbi:MAG: hypothetical protein AAF152_03490 [Cyanobacteria bacterium P01_A01_bin.114]
MKAPPLWHGLALSLTAVLLIACGPKEIPQATQPATPVEVYEIETGTATERVAQIAPILNTAPPSELKDAYFIEERIGPVSNSQNSSQNNQRSIPGPSDYHSFYRLEFEVTAIELWRQALVPLDTEAHYAAPATPRAWWLAPDQFEQLQLYQTDPLTHRIHGWVGLMPEVGEIYIYTYTT